MMYNKSFSKSGKSTVSMKHKIAFIIVLLLLISAIPVEIYSQAYQGYTLFAPNNGRNTYLVNMSNSVYKSWTHTISGGYSSYLLEDGTIMRSANSSNSQLNGGGATGIIQKIDWSGNIVWSYTYSSNSYRAHHDFCPMPNGNVLIVAWEVKTAAQCVAAGLNHNGYLWPDHIIEVQPTGTSGGNIVWEWHVWDHLIQDYDANKLNYGVVSQHPELLDINVGSSMQGDWMHYNGISYSPVLDQVVFSSHNLDELYVIDHSTTTQQAASHQGGKYGKGGDFLYRWGCPSNYRAAGTQVFDVVHNSVFIPEGLPGAGHLLAFNNRERQSTSMVVELNAPQDSAGFYTYVTGTAYGPAAPYWSYTANGFFSNHLGGVQRLPNGNTLIAESTSGYLFEVDSSGNTVWSYNRGGEIVRVLRYGPKYSGLRMLNSSEIVINEFLVLNDSIPDSSGEFDSWIELYNNTNEAITLSGRYLSNDASAPKKWQFPLNTVIQPGGYLTVWADEDITQSGLHSNFSLSPLSGKIILSNIDLTVIDSVSYGVQDTNKSMARIPNGTGQFVSSIPTLNAANQQTPAGVKESEQNPVSFNLYQNYPNPFNPATTIKYSVPSESKITLKIYNSIGEEIKVLVNKIVAAGEHNVTFDAANLPSGVYLYRINIQSLDGAVNSSMTKKMVLLK